MSTTSNDAYRDELFRAYQEALHEGPATKARASKAAARADMNRELSRPVGQQVPMENDYPTGDAPGQVRFLKSSESLRSVIGRGEPSEDVGLGRWLRAMVTGDWSDMPAATKAMGVGDLGGYVVTEQISTRVIDFARNAARVMQAGALTVPMAGTVLKIPRVLNEPVGEWKAENAALASESDLNLDAVTLTAKTLMAIVTLSVELAEDAKDVDRIIERALAGALAVELDRAALYGDASPASEPRGVLATSGVQTIDTTVGLEAGYADFIEAVRIVRSNNFEPNAVIWSPDAAAVFDGLTDTTGQPLRPPASFADLDKLSTNQAAPGDAFVGDWSNLVIGMRTNLILEPSREAATETGNAFSRLQVKVRAYLRADVAVTQAGAFAVLRNIAQAGS